MRSTNLAFDHEYLIGKEDRMFNALTSDYMFKCDNYAVAYLFKEFFLSRLKMCEYSDITEDCFFPYSKIIFITCRPQDMIRMKYVANRIPSSIKANIRIYNEEEEEI